MQGLWSDFIPSRVYSCDTADHQKLKTLMEYDPYLDKSLSEEQLSKLRTDEEANVIFARQDYRIKDGISLDLDREKYYLYLSASDEFLDKAEKKLKKNIPSIRREEPEREERIINEIETERTESEQGLGLIFGE